MRFIDNNYVNYGLLDAQSKVTNKSLRQVFLEQEAQKEEFARGTSKLLKDHATATQYFKDSEAGQYPIDAFQVLDLTINLPLNKYWAQELVPIRYGGGAVESFAFFRSNIALAEGRLAGGNTNEIPTVGISSQKITIPIYAIKLGIVLGMVDIMKSEQINFDMLGRHEEALRTSYWREIEYFAFEGNVGIGDITTSTTNFFPGLLNIPTSGAGIYYRELSADWDTLAVAAMTEVFITAVATMKRNVRFNRDFFPNTIVINPALWTLMQVPAVVGTVGEASSAGVAVSIMEYVQKQIKARLQIDVVFEELPYLQAGAESTDGFPIEVSGKNSNGRIVLYRKDEKVLKMPITMALTGGATLPSPTEDGLRKNYVAFAGPLAIVYPAAIGYVDNAA